MMGSESKNAALRILSRRAISTAKLKEKLTDKGFDPDDINLAIEFCTQNRYLDDEAVARRACEKWMAKGYTGLALTGRLQSIGINREMAHMIQEDMFDPDEETERAVRLLTKNHKPDRPLDRAEQRRLLGALSRRGFSYETAKNALRRLGQEDIEEEP